VSAEQLCPLPLSLISSCRPISRSEAERLAARYQPRLLDFRLRHLQQVAASEFDVPDFSSEMRGVAMTLGAVVEGEPGLQAQLVEALRAPDDGWKAVSAEAGRAMALEALLVACHERRTEIYLHEIATMMNTIGMARFGDQGYETKDVGKILRQDLSLFPVGLEFGNGLRLKGGLPKRIHQLAAAHHTLSSQQPLAGCPLCSALRTAEKDAPPSLPPGAGNVTEPRGVPDTPDLQDVQDVQEVQAEKDAPPSLPPGAGDITEPRGVPHVPDLQEVGDTQDVQEVQDVQDVRAEKDAPPSLPPGAGDVTEPGDVSDVSDLQEVGDSQEVQDVQDVQNVQVVQVETVVAGDEAAA
jgi:hypothetical protein